MSHDEIYLVTGLPRSGTSLCMRMLETGDIPVLTDGERSADEDNPNGYYEFEPVKKTHEDVTWLDKASGKAVKMVYRLLYDLPDNFRYRTLFMRRDLGEVLASQQTMLSRNGTVSQVSDDEMRQLFQRELASFASWIASQPHFNVLEVSFNELIDTPLPVLRRIDEFCGNTLNVEAMHRVIDSNLYRNRRMEAAVQ